jgi:hypothetical protein
MREYAALIPRKIISAVGESRTWLKPVDVIERTSLEWYRHKLAPPFSSSQSLPK